MCTTSDSGSCCGKHGNCCRRNLDERRSEPNGRRQAETTIVTVDPACPNRSRDCCEKFENGQCALENLKIALIGGLDRLERQYRSAFERLGAAKFFFHTGCCAGGGAERLRATTEAADIVVFITKINSHNALSVLKAVCKRSGKSFLAIRATSPDQVSQMVVKELQRPRAETSAAS